MTTRLHSIEPPLGDDEPIVVKAFAAKFLAAFWASVADYLPGYVGHHGIARLEPQSDGLPLMLFTEDPNEPATGTEAINIASDDFDVDLAALQRGPVRLVEQGERSARLADPEGNLFTLIPEPTAEEAAR